MNCRFAAVLVTLLAALPGVAGTWPGALEPDEPRALGLTVSSRLGTSARAVDSGVRESRWFHESPPHSPIAAPDAQELIAGEPGRMGGGSLDFRAGQEFATVVLGEDPGPAARLARDTSRRAGGILSRYASEWGIVAPPPEPVPSVAALLLAPGRIPLQAERDGQWVTLTLVNRSTAPIALVGLNLNLQIADTGPASEGGLGNINGPNIRQVDLVTGTLFAANNSGTTSAEGNLPQAGLWSTTTASGTVSIPANTSLALARVQFDTSGLGSAGSWAFHLGLNLPGVLVDSPTSLVAADASELPLELRNGELVIPEISGTGLVAVALGVFGACRIARRFRGVDPEFRRGCP